MGEQIAFEDYDLGDNAVDNSVDYFERPEIDGILGSSQFEQDVSQQPGYEYGMLLPRSKNLETGETQWDAAGGITGIIGRGLATMDRYLDPAVPVSDSKLMEAAIDVVGPTSSVAGATVGPGQIAGLLGAFNLKHGSKSLFDVFRRSDDAFLQAGPGVYGVKPKDDVEAVSYALRDVVRQPANEEHIAYDVASYLGTDVEDMARRPELYNFMAAKEPRDKALLEDAYKKTVADARSRAEYELMDANSGRHMFFFDDGSAVKFNLYNPTQPNRPVVEPLGPGAGYVYNMLLKETEDDFFDFAKPLYDQAPKYADKLMELAKSTGFAREASLGRTGKEFYTHLASEMGADKASQRLANLGLVGNKFKLKGRDSFVVYDPKSITIEDVSKVTGFANGGIVSMSDRARDMFRGPRGIMSFVPYLGAK